MKKLRGTLKHEGGEDYLPKDWPAMVVLERDRRLAKTLVRKLGRRKAYDVCQIIDRYVKKINRPEFGGLMP